MTLVEAFRILARPVERDEVPMWQEAVALVFREMQALAGRLRMAGLDRDDSQDAVTTVLIRLVQGRPRGAVGPGPADDEAVRAYLRMALLNRLRDMRRRVLVRREAGGEPDDHGVGEGLDVELSLRETEYNAKQELAQAERQLFDEILPSIPMRDKDRAQFLETIEILRDIRAGRKGIDVLIATACGQDNSEEARKRARNALDQRFSRAFKRVLGEIDRLVAKVNLGPERADTLRKVLASLRLRQGKGST